jgi:hypothetical protein
VFGETSGKWLLPIFADPTGTKALANGLLFSEEFEFARTELGFSPVPTAGTATSERSTYEFDWELDEQGMALENQSLLMQYRVLDKQDDILLVELDYTDKQSGRHFVVAERGAKFDGTERESASRFRVEPPLYYQSLINGRPAFLENPTSCDYVNGALFVNRTKGYRFFMSDQNECLFNFSGGERDVELSSNSLFMSTGVEQFFRRKREWEVVATLEDQRLLVIESETYGMEDFEDLGFLIAPRTIVVELTDLSLTGDIWLSLDIDGDGLTNGEENVSGTKYGLSDSDSDGLSDGQEVSLGTNPLLIDTDGDGWSDSEEIMEGSDPLQASSSPTASPGLPIWLMLEAARRSSGALP